MTNVVNLLHLLPACLMGFLLAIATLTTGTAEAQQARDASNTVTIILSAPDPVLDLLKTHFELPSTPLLDETARATFMRRAQREIG